MAIYMWRDVQIPADALYFEANTAGSVIGITKKGGPNAVSLEKSSDGITRADYTIGDYITLTNIGDKVYFRNKSETPTTFSYDVNNYYKFSMSGNISAYGDICYLRCKNSAIATPNYCFVGLFYNCTALKTSPNLPATTLGTYSYYQMFYGCYNLETLPKLPAITMNSFCYNTMFFNCSKIKLSATQTGEYQTPYRIPTSGTGTDAYPTNSMTNMFYGTGGTYTGTPNLNTTYYTSNTII